MTVPTPAPRPSAEEVVERLKGSITASGGIDLRGPDLLIDTIALITSLVEENAALTRAVEKRDEALRPFAEAASRYDENDTCDRVPDDEPVADCGVDMNITVADFRRAASLSDMGGA